MSTLPHCPRCGFPPLSTGTGMLTWCEHCNFNGSDDDEIEDDGWVMAVRAEPG